MNWLHYLVEANIYLGVFYLCYCLFLNNETYYVLGRAYLLFSCLAAFVLPVTQLSILKHAEPQIQQVAYTAPVYHNAPIPEIIIEEPAPQFTLQDALLYIYIIGAVLSLIVLCYRLFRLFLLTRTESTLTNSNYKIIQLNGENTAFSFFNYLFIGTAVPQSETIIAHELVHIRQKHSADIIFIELIKVVSWFNPFIYLLQRSLRTIHEYIADEQTAAKESDALTYSSFLLSNAYGIQGSPIAHSFFNYNLLKKRIIMLNQKRSGRLARLKYLAAVPLCAGMLCASTLVFSKDYALIDLSPKRPVAELRDTAFAMRPPTVFGKDFSLQENCYLIDKKAPYITVTITSKSGHQQLFNSSSATNADRKLLKDKYGYQFKKAEMMAYLKMTSKSNEAFSNNPQLPPPPPPVPLNEPYLQLAQFISRSVKYPTVALSKKLKASLIVNFKLNENGRISDVAVAGNNANIFGDVLKAELEKFAYPIKDKAGYHKMGVKFFILGENSVFFATPKSLKTANYIGEMQVIGIIAAQRKIYNQPPPPPAPPKVGVAPPKVKVIKFPPPAVKPPLPIGANNQTFISSFNKELARTIRYPAREHDNQTTGKLFIAFTVKYNKIGNVAVTRGVSNALDAEAKRALVDYSPTVRLKAGSYEIPIAFKITKADGKIVFNTLAGIDKEFVDKSVINNHKIMLSEVVLMSYL
ncbi:hypothetical protein A0256_11925 [Mucilaginibacter sp. PAMC 26640]|nr:hypothetical protein A0256_11925 [Mucilaginibacter sp. PAMC 26640]